MPRATDDKNKITPNRKKYQIDIRGEKLTIGPDPWLMGILNVTPDSFSDGGQFFEPDRAAERAAEMIDQGARIIDIGGESTRPGAREIAVEEEIKRVLPVIKKLRPRTKALISIDTRKSRVARVALEEGVDLVNDISGLGHDREMTEVVAEFQVPIIIMHMLGTPETMQIAPHYNNLLFDLKHFFLTRIRQALTAGIPEDRIIIDPGIGFGKTLEHNLQLINNLEYFLDLGKPVLVGPSRKSFIGLILGVPAEQRLEGTIAASILSWLHGAAILRVHDVLQVKRALQVTESIVKEIKVEE